MKFSQFIKNITKTISKSIILMPQHFQWSKFSLLSCNRNSFCSKLLIFNGIVSYFMVKKYNLLAQLSMSSFSFSLMIITESNKPKLHDEKSRNPNFICIYCSHVLILYRQIWPRGVKNAKLLKTMNFYDKTL